MLKSLWALPLQLASFKGIPFEVTSTDYEMNRAVAVHEFPFADLPVVEDLGLGTQTIKMSAFLVGDDVYAKRDSLLRVTKSKGQGELIHPSLGSVKATLVGCGYTEAVNEGRIVSVELSFIVTGNSTTLTWQTITPNRPSLIQEASDNVKAALGGDFIDTVTNDLKSGVAVVTSVTKQVSSYLSVVRQVVGDASRIVHAADGITHMIGGMTGSRYARIPTSGSGLTAINNALSGASRVIGTANRITSGVNSLISLSSRTYNDVNNAINATTNLVSLL